MRRPRQHLGGKRSRPRGNATTERAHPTSTTGLIGPWKYSKVEVYGSRTCKPNSVCLAAGRSFLWAAHCCAAQATYPKVPTHRAGTRSGLLELPPYLVLLRVGFALPATSLSRRCALTAPLHPYLSLSARAVCFLWHLPSNRLEPAVPDVIRHTALRSSDFPLSCDSDRPVRLPTAPL